MPIDTFTLEEKTLELIKLMQEYSMSNDVEELLTDVIKMQFIKRNISADVLALKSSLYNSCEFKFPKSMTNIVLKNILAIIDDKSLITFKALKCGKEGAHLHIVIQTETYELPLILEIKYKFVEDFFFNSIIIREDGYYMPIKIPHYNFIIKNGERIVENKDFIISVFYHYLSELNLCDEFAPYLPIR